MQVVQDSVVHAKRKFSVTADGVVGAVLYKGYRSNSWEIKVARDPAKPYDHITNEGHYRAPCYHSAVRLAACYLAGQMDRVEHLQRGNWINDGIIAVPEKIL
jgi:hypothetical protein